MEKLNVLIVEDELLTLEDLREILEKHNFNVRAATTGKEAIESVIRQVPDLIIMDIQLKGEMDGIDAATQINDIADIPIIYLSSHKNKEMVSRAKHTYPANYLSKPFDTQDLLRALEIAFFNTKKNSGNHTTSGLSDRIFIRTDKQTSEMVAYDEIIHVVADRSYSTIVAANREFILSSNLKKVKAQFNHQDFLRVHRGHMVNIKHITGIEGNTIKLTGGHTVQMGDTYKDEVLRKINIIK